MHRHAAAPTPTTSGTESPSAARVRRFQARVLDWGDAHRRDLPWRATRDPWRVLVSEVMLQQTQVDRVIGSYAAFLDAYKSSRVTYYEPISDEPAREAAEMVFGRRDLPSYRIDQAEVLISFGADFLETWRSPIELARQYAEFRAPKNRGGALTIGRAIYVGPRFNMTAAKCDEWIASPAGAGAMLALAILHVMLAQGWVQSNSGIDVAALRGFAASYDPASVSQKTGVSAERISTIAERFGKADGAIALAGGDDPTLYAAAYILNAATGNLGRTMQFFEGEPPEIVAKSDDVAAAIEAIRIGIVGTSSGANNGVANLDFTSSRVDVVVIAGSNPLYAMPRAWRTEEAFKKVPLVVWMGTVPDESADLAHLLLPIHHPLETWRDIFPRAGVHGLASRSCNRSSRADLSATFSSVSRIRAAAHRYHGKTLPMRSKQSGRNSAAAPMRTISGSSR